MGAHVHAHAHVCPGMPREILYFRNKPPPLFLWHKSFFMGSGCSVGTPTRVMSDMEAVRLAHGLDEDTMTKISTCQRDWPKKSDTDKVRSFAAMKRDWVATFDGIEAANATGTFSLKTTGDVTEMVANYRGYLPKIGKGEEDETEEAVLGLPVWDRKWVLSQMFAFVALTTPVLGKFQGLQLQMERKVAELNANREEARHEEARREDEEARREEARRAMLSIR